MKTPGEELMAKLNRQQRERSKFIDDKVVAAIANQPEVVQQAREENWYADLRWRLREIAAFEFDSKQHRYHLLAVTAEEVKIFQQRVAARRVWRSGAFKGMNARKESLSDHQEPCDDSPEERAYSEYVRETAAALRSMK